MMKPKYIFLTLSLVELTIGLSNARQNVFFYLGFPVGAILFGLFLIAQVMEKESALYDEQNRAAKLEREPDVSSSLSEWNLTLPVGNPNETGGSGFVFKKCRNLF